MTASSTTSGYRAPGPAAIAGAGLWPVLGVSPLVYAADSMETGLILGLVCLTAVCATGLLAWLSRGRAITATRPAAVMLLLAANVTFTGLMLQAFLYDWYLILAPALPLIMANAGILGLCDGLATARKPEPLWPCLRLGLFTALALGGVGMARDGLQWSLGIIADFHSATAPAAAFLVLAALAVVTNAVTRRGSTGP